MNKGFVRITNELIKEALGFPVDWEVEFIQPATDRSGNITYGESVMLISGVDFPEVDNSGRPKTVRLIIHEKARTFEIKEIT